MTKVASIAYEDLLALVESRNGTAVRQVTNAYEFALNAHGNARRDSGELYIDHDLAVAYITAELSLDTTIVVASILHDVLLPHTGKKAADIEIAFGKSVTELVVGMKELFAYTEGDRYKEQQLNGEGLENVRKAIVSVIKGNIHVILIRMADCLHDLRRAKYLPETKRLEIAREVKNIYAPLANRLGIWQVKWEMEDLAFRHLQPDDYNEIAEQLDERREARSKLVKTAVAQLQANLKEAGIKAHVTGRAKHIYSIYRKMRHKRLTFDKIYDVQALRVIVEPTDPEAYKKKNLRQKDFEDRAICYQVLAVVHELWRAVPGEFDDYISTPKENGYRSLHTAVIDRQTGQTLEVQIRTQRMHEEAEKGIAAHWAYKEDGDPGSAARKQVEKMRTAVAQLLESDHATTDGEVFETEIAAERFHVFTPRGDVFDLPVGSTPIDFAYQVHTEVGNRCRGARVNGKMVSLDYRLKPGDQVEIMTAKRGGPSRDWMNSSLGYTGSARTRSKIRQWFRQQEREQNIEQGREAVTRELKRLGLLDTFSIADIARGLHYDDEENFLAKVGFGDIQSNQISGAIALLKRDLEPDDEIRPLLTPQPPSKGLTVQGLSGLATKMAGCCNPIAPEPIVGYITRGHGITIHRLDCKTIADIDERERLIDVSWGEETERYPVPIVVKAYRSPNLIENIVATFRGRNINVPKTKSVTTGSTMTVYLVVEVATLEELNWLLQKLESTQNVIEATRQRWN
ncbi:MAG: bifunctional (p)ppGpp synthetase/guanosine-3',5'-bis(diphosphate) 3'-pyrophosphohydrolase [Ardenticatenaceae bacterium]|nr:bifunctional (p)ppGpp synthetase/guanosine-3',5'-bis(diphosphate) 3'-pyrophosphohydrolase [Ardenticatenaceae bacterium]